MERGVRFGCGFGLGVIVAFGLAVKFAVGAGSQLIAVTLVSGFICGVLAARFGDRFWYAIRHLDWFLP